MSVAQRVLAMHEEALRYDQMEVVLGAGHGDVEQAPFFLKLMGGAGTQI